MKLRVKLSGQSRPIDFGETDTSNLTLQDLKASVSEAFNLDDRNVELSLNKRDVLNGDEVVLTDFGIVPGDLIHVLGHDGPQNIPAVDRHLHQRQQPIASFSGSNKVVVLDRNQHSNDDGDPRNDQPTQATSTSASTLSSCQTDPSTSHSAGVNDANGMEVEDQSLELIKRPVQEPLVIGESTPSQVPALLKELYSGFDITCPNDALFVLLHALMIESGFSLPGKTDIASIPSEWKRSGFYICTYEYALTPDVCLECSLMAVPTGSSVAVHGLSKTVGNFKTDHLQLKAESYVRDISQGNAPAAFRSLDRLSNLFKDTIGLHLQNHLARSAGFRETQGLLSLPCEVRMRLMCFLDAKSICDLGQTCQQWAAIYKDRSLWRRLYLQSFETPADSSLSRNWYEMFKKTFLEYKEEQERRRYFHQRVEEDFHLHRFPRPPFGPFNPVYPLPDPRFLGGEHDLNPEFASGIPDLLNGRPGNTGLRGLPAVPQVPSPFGNRGRTGRGRGNLTGSPFFGQGPFM